MSLKQEIQVYDRVNVSLLTGETESYEPTFFTNVIRKKELLIIKNLLLTKKPKLVLDYGCGGGWLSRIMSDWGFKTIGIDLSINLVKTAKLVCCEGDFVICDAMRLPFRDDAFDFIIGISILHHLQDLKLALKEVRRVSIPGTFLLFMEPNSLNPISAFGRKFFPMEAHTKGEKPFIFKHLKQTLCLAGFELESYFAMFFLSFPIARLFKIIRTVPPLWLVKMILLFEDITEKIPGVRSLNSNIVALIKATNNAFQ